MPKRSRFGAELEPGVAGVAVRLRKRMSEVGLSQVELAARCMGTAQDLFTEEQAPQITRERIAKILMHCKAKPGKSAAHIISHSELQVLARVLRVSLEWLVGPSDGRELVLWDPLADPMRAEHILHLINEHEERAAEVLIWAESLICSLETPEFMHKHHEGLFKELDMLDAHDEKLEVVQIYDNIGNARRKRVLDSKRKDRRLVQFIFASDFEKIVRGKGEYASIPKGIRKACLENLCRLIADSSLGIELVIVSDQVASGTKAAFRDYDWVWAFDESLVLWRYHSGRVAWSEHPEHTRCHRRLLQKLQNCAINGNLQRTDTLRVIRTFAESITG